MTLVPLLVAALAAAAAMPAEAAAQAPAVSAPFTPAVAAGDFVYLSGMLATDASGAFVPGDVRAQTARVLDNLAALLAKHGSRMEQVAAVTVYLKNQSDFAAMNEVYAQYFVADFPARSAVQVAALPRGASVEIEIVAHY